MIIVEKLDQRCYRLSRVPVPAANMPDHQTAFFSTEQGRPNPEQRVTLAVVWRFFLVVVVGILAGYFVECLEAVQAVVETLPGNRHR